MEALFLCLIKSYIKKRSSTKTCIFICCHIVIKTSNFIFKRLVSIPECQKTLFFDLKIYSDCLKNFLLPNPRPLIAWKSFFWRFRGLGMLEKLYFVDSEVSDWLKNFILLNPRPRIAWNILFCPIRDLGLSEFFYFEESEGLEREKK